jgi:hypothetical protein
VQGASFFKKTNENNCKRAGFLNIFSPKLSMTPYGQGRVRGFLGETPKYRENEITCLQSVHYHTSWQWVFFTL